MNRRRRVTLCDTGRFLVSRPLRDELGWILGDTIAISRPQNNRITITLHNEDTNSPYSGVIDETGRLPLPQEVLETLGWGKGDILFVTGTPDGKGATVVRYKKADASKWEHPGRRFGFLYPGDFPDEY